MTLDEHTRSQSLSPDLASRGSEHGTTRAAEMTVQGSDAPAAAPADDLAPGTSLNRYLILGRLGAGAMGVVFAAWDPELDRKIALKLLHPRAGTSIDNRARLLREAKALARLSHPNVVGVHDVGTFHDRVFLAMEFVAGRTLTAWLKEQPRRWPEIVAVLRRAGEGLAAAHDAGLIHRDFKPDNVLIADDGRVCVLDFGLARNASEAPESGAVDPETLAILASASASYRRGPEQQAEHDLVTRTGALVGTPAYMSPEQHMGSPADARSDQFSFCVTLYQALYGVRPFTAQRLSSLSFQIIQGKIEAPPPGARVPAWLRRVVLRGLSVDPSDRFPSMRSLLAALDPNRDRARRGSWLLGGLGGLGLGLGLWLGQAPAAEPPCRGGDARLAGVWDPARAAEAERAFTASEVPYAADVWRVTRPALDAYAREWARVYDDTCAATEIRHEQSAELLDLRMRCLERRRVELQALGDALLEPTAGTIEHAPEASRMLGDLETCSDVEALRAVVPPPEDKARVREIEAQIARAAGLALAGDLTAASEASTLAAASATALGYDPLIAQALLVRARVQQRLSAVPAAGESLAAAILAAARGRDDRTAALAWVDLAFHTGAYQPDETRLSAHLRAAEAAVARAGDDPLLRARLDHGAAAGHQRLGRPRDALAPAIRAVEVFAGDPTRYQQSLNVLALVQHGLGRLDDAAATFRRALQLTERVSGVKHPARAALLVNVAELELDRGNLDAADRFARESDAVRREVLPHNHIEHADSARTLAHVAERRGDLAAAEARYREALAIYLEHPDVDPMYVGMLYNDLGGLATNQENLAAAREHFTAALKLFSERFGPEHAYVATVEHNLNEALVWLGEPRQAVPLLEAALARAERTGVADTTTAWALTMLGEAFRELGRTAEAITALERAVTLFDADDGDPLGRERAAIARTVLAQALAAAGRDEPRRRQLRLLAEPVLRDADIDDLAVRRALASLERAR